jgi:hypothetical protein
LLCPDAHAQSDLPPEARALAEVKQRMSAFLARVPDYTCVETIDRSVQKSASEPAYSTDRLRVDIAYINNKEVYSWPGAGSFEEKRLADLVGNGMISDGDFALHTGNIFARDGAQISFGGDEQLLGRKAARYDYRIPSLSSAWTLRSASEARPVGTRGSFWIDRDRLDLLRLELDAQNIPPDLPIHAVHVRIDYSRVRVGGVDISIPQSSETLLDDAAGARYLNHVDFTGCREYHVQSAISFDTESQNPETKTRMLQNVTVPSNLLLPLRLDQPIDSGTAAQGDLVVAKVERDVRTNDGFLVPRGALVKGRIRRMEKFDQPRSHWVLAIELTAIEFDNRAGEMAGTLEHIDPVRATKVQLVRALSPGVGALRIDGGAFRLDRGFHMQWLTVDWRR